MSRDAEQRLRPEARPDCQTTRQNCHWPDCECPRQTKPECTCPFADGIHHPDVCLLNRNAAWDAFNGRVRQDVFLCPTCGTRTSDVDGLPVKRCGDCGQERTATIEIPMILWNRAMSVIGAASVFTNRAMPGQLWRQHVRDDDYQRLHRTVIAFDREAEDEH